MKRRSFRAFALAFTLSLTLVVIVAMTALLATAGRSLFTASQYHQRAIAQLAAEAGLARAQAALEANTGFEGELKEELPHSGGRFAVDITKGAPVSGQSVNNLQSASSRDLAEGVLPAHAALIVSRGSCRGYEVTLKAYVRRADESFSLSLLASDRIDLRNRTSIRGVQSLTSSNPIPAGVHSNRTEPGVAIFWRGPNAGDTLTATGNLSTSAPDDGSISLIPAASATVNDTLTDQPRRPQLDTDIKEIVSLHTSSPGPVFPPTGLVTLPSGDHYYGGDQEIHGDLVLRDGAKIYVDGDLTVNGTISGRGTVVVTGFTALKGDSHLSTADGDYIALMSREGVALTGFDGTAFMDALASSDAAIAQNWSRVKTGFAGMQARVAMGHGGWVGDGNDTHFDNARYLLARPNQSAHGLEQVMPSGPTGKFLADKFYEMRLFYHNAWHDIDDQGIYSGLDRDGKLEVAEQVTESYLQGDLRPDQGGIADAVSSQEYSYADLPPRVQEAVGRVATAIQSENLDKLGTAWFKGFVYSNGPIYVANEMTVVGCLESQGLPGVPSRTFGTVSMDAGDIYLAPRSDLIYVGDLMKTDLALGRSGLLKVLFRFEG